MTPLHDVSAEAQNDVFEIWRRIADDSVELANRIESEFYEIVRIAGTDAGSGHTRRDLIKRSVLFFPLYSSLIVYQPDVKPIRIMAVLRGTRNVKRILQERV